MSSKETVPATLIVSACFSRLYGKAPNIAWGDGASTANADVTPDIDWGDGSSSAGQIAANPDPTIGGWIVNGTHTYAVNNPGQIQVTIDDEGGLAVGNSTITVGGTPTVSFAPFTVTGSDAQWQEGQAVSGVVVGTLVDSARVDATGNFSGKLSFDAPNTPGVSPIDLSFVYQGLESDGAIYTILANFPAMMPGSYACTLTVHETSAGPGSLTNVGHLTVNPIVPGPTELDATAVSPHEIDLAWVNNDPNADTFYVDRADVINGTVGTYGLIAQLDAIATPANATGYHDTSAADGATYSYLVYAAVTGVNSLNSNVTAESTQVSIPNDLQAHAVGADGIALSWTNDSVNAAHVTIWRFPDSSLNPGLAMEVTPSIGFNAQTGRWEATDWTVTPDTHYYYQVRTIGLSGQPSAWSNSADAATPPVAGLFSATNVAAGEIDLSWLLSVQNVTAMEIDRATSATGTFVPIATDLSPLQTGYQDADPALVAGSRYFYQLVILKPGRVLVSAPADAWTTPDVSTVGVTGTEIDIAWPTAGTNADTVEVDRSMDNWASYMMLSDTVPASAGVYQDTGRALGSHYWYRVVARQPDSFSPPGGLDTWTLDRQIIAGAALTETAGEEFTAVAADFPMRPGTDLSGFTATIDWGDGQMEWSPSVTVNGAGGFSVTGTHTYSTPVVQTTTVQLFAGGLVVGQAIGSADVVDAAPMLATAATATLSPDGTTADLDVLASDFAGEGDLTYTWATTGTPPAPVTYDGNGSNDAKHTVVTFTAIGTYNFTVTIENSEGLSITSNATVDVEQVDSDIAVSPDWQTILAGDTQQLSAIAYDQFGLVMETPPTFTWIVTDGPGAVDSSGLYSTAVTDSGSADIQVTASDNAGASGGTSIDVTPNPQIVVTAVGATEVVLQPSAPSATSWWTVEQKGPDESWHVIGSMSALLASVDVVPFETYSFRLHAILDGQSYYSEVTSIATPARSSSVPAPESPYYGAGFTETGAIFWSQASYDASECTPAGILVEALNADGSGTWQALPKVYGGPVQPLDWTAVSRETRLSELYIVNGVGLVASMPTSVSTAALSQPTLPAPGNLTVTAVSGGQFTASWTPTGTQTAIQLLTSPFSFGGPVVQIQGSISSWTFGAGSARYVAVFSGGAGGTFSPTVAAAIPQPSTKPQAPTNLFVTPFYYDDGDAQKIGAGLIWDDNAFNEGGYVIERSEGSITGTYQTLTTPALAADTETYEDKTIEPGHNYFYRVKSTNAMGDYGAASYATGAYVVPNAPTGVTAVAGEKLNYATGSEDPVVNVTWDPAYAGGFEIQWSTDGTDFFTVDTVPQSGGYGVTQNADFNVTNYYRIVAFADVAGVTIESLPSNIDSDTLIAPPVAIDDTIGGLNAAGDNAPYTSEHGAAVTVSEDDGVLANDVDLADPPLPLHVSDFTQPANGTVTVNADGSFTYTPNHGFLGEDTFTYTVSNNALESTAEVAIDCYDPAPTASNALFPVDADGYLNTDSRPLDPSVVNLGGEELAYRLADDSGPKHGTLTFNPDGSFTYVANPGFHGWDHFNYVASDGYADSNVASVTLVPPNTHERSWAAGSISFGTDTEAMTRSYNEAKSRLNTLSTALQIYKSAVGALAADPDNEDGMNAVIDTFDKVQAAFDGYFAQYTALTRDTATYLNSGWTYFTKDFDLITEIHKLPADPFNLKMSDSQVSEFAAAAADENSTLAICVNTMNSQIQKLTVTRNVLEGISYLAGITAAAKGVTIFTIKVAAKEICRREAAVIAGKLVASLAVQKTVSVATEAATAKIAAAFGFSEDTVRYISASIQFVCLLKAWRFARLLANAGCFTGDTLVDTTNHGEQTISTVQVGERVDTSVNDGSGRGAPPETVNDGNATAVDPATWRLVRLTTADSQNSGGSYQMHLLEPLSWISQNHAIAGSMVYLSHPELQIHGLVQVQSITACPAIEAGAGRVVLGTFEHVAASVVDVNLVGENQPLKVTAGHKLWSLDRDGWVNAGDLHAGERLAGQNGPITVASVTTDSTPEAVYNLDVETDHRYLVSSLGVLAHNVTGDCGTANLLAELRRTPDDQRRLLREALNTEGTGKIAHHIIPLEAEKKLSVLMVRAAKGGFNINGKNNGIPLIRDDHVDGHPDYNKAVLDELRQIARKAGRLTDSELAGLVQDAADTLRRSINGGTFGPWG